MGVEMRILLVIIALVISLPSIAYADDGLATYYDPPYVPSPCFGNEDNGVMVAGASNVIWNNRAACGKHYNVRCAGPANEYPHPCTDSASSVVVKIVDYCPPPGCNGTINLSRDAFSKIANIKAGLIKVKFDQV